MSEQNQDSKKAIISFVVGLLIGGLVVSAFMVPADPANDMPMNDDDREMMDENSDEAMDDMDMSDNDSNMSGEANIEVEDQPASSSISLTTAEYPVAEGWIGVRQYNDGQLGSLLGVVRFSSSQGLMPQAIQLVAPTTAGSEYAVVIFEEDGDFDFSTTGDVEMNTVFDTFTAE